MFFCCFRVRVDCKTGDVVGNREGVLRFVSVVVFFFFGELGFLELVRVLGRSRNRKGFGLGVRIFSV